MIPTATVTVLEEKPPPHKSSVSREAPDRATAPETGISTKTRDEEDASKIHPQSSAHGEIAFDDSHAYRGGQASEAYSDEEEPYDHEEGRPYADQQRPLPWQGQEEEDFDAQSGEEPGRDNYAWSEQDDDRSVRLEHDHLLPPLPQPPDLAIEPEAPAIEQRHHDQSRAEVV